MCKTWFRRLWCSRIIFVVVAAMLAVVATWTIGSAPAGLSQYSKPNIVFILTDDLDAKSIKYLPRLRSLMIDRGTTFEHFFVTNSLCCPSRASILTGQYAHNHGVLTNQPSNGGYRKFHYTGKESSTIATWLKAEGYRTMLAGKYLNGYRGAEPLGVPPGWDEWYAAREDGAYSNISYYINENGRLVGYFSWPEDYLTDVIARKATDFIQRTATDTRPFFLYLATYAPHLPATPAPRHENEFPNTTAPRSPSFNEEDIGDKPEWVRRRTLLTPGEIREIDDLYRRRLQSLLAIDDMIEKIIRLLEVQNQLSNTFVFFTSDNGFHMGEHRLTPGKETAYEEDIRVPLIVRGPGVPAGRTVEQLTLNIDLAPTFAELGGAPSPETVDGLSLVPLLSTGLPSVNAWRKEFLVEHWMSGQSEVPQHSALRTQYYLYVEYVTGERELYDLRTDPFELKSIHDSAPRVLIRELAERLDALRQCKAATCRTR